MLDAPIGLGLLELGWVGWVARVAGRVAALEPRKQRGSRTRALRAVEEGRGGLGMVEKTVGEGGCSHVSK